jgi:hypothetical protein
LAVAWRLAPSMNSAMLEEAFIEAVAEDRSLAHILHGWSRTFAARGGSTKRVCNGR